MTTYSFSQPMNFSGLPAYNPDTVDIKSHSMDRTTQLKHFFTAQSKKAPGIS